MFAKYWTKSSLLVGLAAATLVAGQVLADRGGRGGGGHGGGGGSGRSYSGGGGGGGHSSSRSFSSGGSGKSFSGGGGASSMRSFSGGSGRSFSGGSSSSMRSFSGGGSGNSARSWSRGSDSASSARSFRSSGESGGSSWSGGGSSRSFSRSGSGNPSWSGGEAAASPRSFSGRSRQFNDDSGSQAPSSRFRDFSGNTRSSGESAASQFRGYRGLGQDAGQSDVSGGSNAQQFRTRALGENANRSSNFGQRSMSQNSGSDQLREMFRKHQEQQAAGGANRQLGGSTPKNSGESQRRLSDFQNRTRGDGENSNRPGGSDELNRFRSARDRSSKSNEGDAKSNFDNQVRNWRGGGERNFGKAGDRDGKNFADGKFDRSQFDRSKFPNGDNRTGRDNRGGSEFGDRNQFGRDNQFAGKNFDWAKHRNNWSKKDGGFDPKTARWYGKSGFGDHRDRGDWRDGNRDKYFADSVRKNWRNDWWDKRGGHDHDGRYRHGRGRWDRAYYPFAYSWWAGYGRYPSYYYWNDRRWRDDPWYWWGYCSAPVLTTWIDFGWNYPCYWDYGPGEYITYYNNTVYVDNQRYATELEYYAQVRNLARSVPTLTQDQLAGIEWLPLGVFAVTRAGQADSTELVQLAVSKDGILSGTLFNQQTGQARPLQGMVEQATQRAAWCFADSATDALVVETSLFNLTEAECTALAHLDAVSTEVWRLVRLEQPQQPAGGQPPAAVGAPANPAGAVPLPPQGGVN